ncbi:Wzz/FepE/Etk N-terminal domain-containing protein [Kaistia defluvii]|uniref:Wzz/FepE/Etk N-terminal domain-containing protein n=1 Tax=Kaistia defluvii TaxID=410841 RepID=UPI002254B06E|nr:Wzz/FepE/Etk N-terminal domain-containing protein [Kaistia defluvii]MCX5519161.1 Wzz/FepE/Etk N-terminal domain-containing protein [Kaistia defluvii]
MTRPPELAAESGGVFDPASDAIDLSALFGLLRRQLLLILLTTALFVGAGLAYCYLADKVYQATTRVLLDPRDKQLVGPEVVRPTQGVDLSWIETQVDLVTASGTLRKVVERENLIDDPEFGGTGSPSDMDAVLTSLARHVRAERGAQTYVIDIIVSSTSPEKAARLSIAVAEAFMASLTEAKQNAARQANLLIARQIDDLKAKAREAEDRVEAYRKENGVVQVDGRPVDEQTLKQLNEANVTARLKADEASSRLAKLDAIARTNGGDLASALSSIDSPVLGRLKVEYAMALREQAELQQTLGDRHPRMQAIGADIARSRSLIAQELNNLVARARVEADLAKSQVASSAAALAAATRKVSETSDASVALRDLEGEAAIRRDVYRAFVARAQETGLQENLQVSDARIISPAQVPLYPSSPRKKIILGLAGIGGLGVGLALALYRGRTRPARPAVRERLHLVEDPVLPQAEPEPEPVAALASESPDVLAEIGVPGSLASGDALTEEAAGELIGGVAVDSRPAFQALAEALTRPGDTEGPAVHVLFGTAASGAIAAVAYGLARVMAEEPAETLLIDANSGTVTTGSSLIGRDVHGILDVDFNHAEADAIGSRLEDASIVLLPAASARLRHEIGFHGDRLVETIRDVADGFERVVVDLGPSCPPALFNALIGIADDVVMVVDAQEADTPEIRAMFADLRHLVPDLRGMVATRATTIVVETPPATAMA